MRYMAKYTVLTVPSKLDCEIRVNIDTASRLNPVYTNRTDETDTSSLRLFPFFTIKIHRPPLQDDDGKWVSAPWDPNDSLSMTKYTLPIFDNSLRELYESMKTPDLYSYRGERLELNEKIANTLRKAFKLGNPATGTVVELIPSIIKGDENTPSIEAIKMTFNKETSSVTLSLNDTISLLYTLENTDMDCIALQLYQARIARRYEPKAEAKRQAKLAAASEQ